MKLHTPYSAVLCLPMASSSPSPVSIAVGCRVTKDGFRATVRYVGPVATSKSTDTVYAGVEWDDATRGKNDGAVCTIDGIETRYFK